MSTESPLFSVVIPAYNASKFIALTIESILRQTVQDFEIVVVNDGSTDDTLQVLQDISDPRLRIITQDNGGECAARNRGIKEAHGQYIALLDADDAWSPNHLEIMLHRIQKHADIPWFVTPVQIVPDIKPEDLRPARDNGCTITNWYLEAHIIPASSSTVVKREFITSIPDIFPVGYKMFGDALGWARLAKRHPEVAVVEARTVLYRFWNGNVSTTHNVSKHGMRTEAVKKALAKHLEFYHEPDCPPEARLYYRQFALGNWWSCISSALMPEEWREDLRNRKTLVGSGASYWMRLWSKLADTALHFMRWGVRRRKLAVMRKMKRMAKACRIHYN